jgi:hypothetical protein
MARASVQTARKVLSSLIDGVHPTTGEELTKESVLQDVDIVRCLMIARDALATVDARAARRAQLPSAVGKTWTTTEEARLIAAFQAGESTHKIAEDHSRTMRAIEARLQRLGLITASQRLTQDSFYHNTPPEAPKNRADHD